MGSNKIQFKRKATEGAPTSSNGKVLASGEPFYNLADKHLYVGNADNEEIETKKHIAEVTVQQAGDYVNGFQIGEDEDNVINLTNLVLDGGSATEISAAAPSAEEGGET